MGALRKTVSTFALRKSVVKRSPRLPLIFVSLGLTIVAGLASAVAWLADGDDVDADHPGPARRRSVRRRSKTASGSSCGVGACTHALHGAVRPTLSSN